jgi:hypothetical protein
MGWFFLDKRRAEHSACPITTADIQEVHGALFAGTDFASKVGLRETIRLILACVGVEFSIAANKKEARRGDGYTQSYGSGGHIELDSQKPGLSAAHFRKICGIIPLKDDGTFLFNLDVHCSVRELKLAK